MSTIKEDYVSFEVAKLLKEKGFKEECEYFYDEYKDEDEYVICSNGGSVYNDDEYYPTYYSMPTIQAVLNWLTEAHDIYYDIKLLLADKAEEYGDLQLGVYRLNCSGAYEWKCWLYADTYKELYKKYVKYCLTDLI